jgi:proteic killer suppression protein
MINSFADRITEDLYNGISSARVRRLPPEVRELALYKLDTLNAVVALKELRSPPGNRLEALKSDLAGFYSIRIQKQWRIIFRWQGSEAFDLQIINYH